MKKILLLMVLGVLVLTGCNKDEGNKFNYDLKTLYGTWDITDAYSNGEWIDITKPGFEDVAASATFKENGVYEGAGFFGNGTGTYKAIGNTITCFISDKEFARYDVISLNSINCELKMTMGTSSMNIKCKKR